MLKSEFQAMLVNFWVLKSGGGAPKSYILKSGRAVAPPAPLVPPPMIMIDLYALAGPVHTGAYSGQL